MSTELGGVSQSRGTTWLAAPTAAGQKFAPSRPAHPPVESSPPISLVGQPTDTATLIRHSELNQPFRHKWKKHDSDTLHASSLACLSAECIVFIITFELVRSLNSIQS